MTGGGTMIDLESEVRINITGRVVARTESVDRPDKYLVEYTANDRTVQEWMRGDRLQEVVAHG